MYRRLSYYRLDTKKPTHPPPHPGRHTRKYLTREFNKNLKEKVNWERGGGEQGKREDNKEEKLAQTVGKHRQLGQEKKIITWVLFTGVNGGSRIHLLGGTNKPLLYCSTARGPR